MRTAPMLLADALLLEQPEIWVLAVAVVLLVYLLLSRICRHSLELYGHRMGGPGDEGNREYRILIQNLEDVQLDSPMLVSIKPAAQMGAFVGTPRVFVGPREGDFNADFNGEGKREFQVFLPRIRACSTLTMTCTMNGQEDHLKISLRGRDPATNKPRGVFPLISHKGLDVTDSDSFSGSRLGSAHAIEALSWLTGFAVYGVGVGFMLVYGNRIASTTVPSIWWELPIPVILSFVILVTVRLLRRERPPIAQGYLGLDFDTDVMAGESGSDASLEAPGISSLEEADESVEEQSGGTHLNPPHSQDRETGSGASAPSKE